MDDIDESETLKRANAATDVLVKCDISAVLTVEKGSFNLEYCFTRDQIQKKDRNQLMSLLETNMKEYYDKTWGWDRAEKTNEIFSNDSKFLILRSASTQSIAAYIMFKFDWDDLDEPEHPVLFCYELQVDEAFRGTGLGKELMKMLQVISRNYNMWKTMLTCFKCNGPAMTFYKHIGFDIDCNSPSKYGFDECYEILSDKPRLR